MKKLITILSMLPLLIMAQAPQGFTYQAVATDNNGFELQNQTISIQASILSSSATGTAVWQETHNTTTDTFGLFNVVIGEGTSTNNGSSATFQEIDWGAASHFMKVEIDVNGGTNYVHVGTSQMMSVPYALYAENTELDSNTIATMIANILSSSLSGGYLFVSQNQFFIVPKGVSTVFVEVWAAGGGSVHNSCTNYNDYSGGGTGAYIRASIQVQEDDSLIFDIGAGGSYMGGGDGGSTSIEYNNITIILAEGGTSSLCQNPGQGGAGFIYSNSVVGIIHDGYSGLYQSGTQSTNEVAAHPGTLHFLKSPGSGAGATNGVNAKDGYIFLQY